MEETINRLEQYRTQLLMELDSIDNVIECSLDDYKLMIDFALEKGYEGIVDIGCAHGFQNELCRNKIDYVGINNHKLDFYRQGELGVKYITKEYPFETQKNYKNSKYLAISSLCLGWKCYEYEHNTFDNQFRALSNDFVAVLLHVPVKRKELLKKYFKNVETVQEHISNLVSSGFYYCYN